ncbi:hypothetical protein WMQ28_12995 [Vibrio metschnikovii]|uniref:hypothetical protein n=1 Tax=Vibrio metschnikovii TaxID=28172 RepID=UPI003752E350
MNVMVIGSCRVVKAYRQMLNQKLITTEQNNSYWYTHSTKDALQKISILTGNITLPDSMVDLVIRGGAYNPESHSPNYLQSFDAFIIEICSLSVTKLNNFICQKHAFDTFASSKSESELESLNFDTYKQNESEVLNDLNTIHSLLGGKKLLLVSHFMLPSNNGKIISSRIEALNYLKRFESESSNVKVYDPTADIIKYGLTEALDDPYHYSEKYFKQQLPKLLLKQINSI